MYQRSGGWVLALSLGLAGLAFLAYNRGTLSRGRSAVELRQAPKITVADLLKQAPVWAPATSPSVSPGFNAWMDTLPFGDNYHKQLQAAKDRQAYVENERLNNPHFLLRRVEANNKYLKSRVDFLGNLLKQREGVPDPIEVDILHPGREGRQGPKGPMGPPGPQGDQGPQGPKGADGALGNPGVDGPPGVQGPDGLHGDRGVMGGTGPTGPQGAKGIRGSTGPAGPAGPPGVMGPPFSGDGPVGPPGPPGVPGPQGTEGPAGPVGPPGQESVGNLEITDIIASTGKTLRTGILKPNEGMRSDGQTTYTEIPGILYGQPYILTPSYDSNSNSATYLKFTVNRPANVYVLYAAGGTPPSWLSSGFAKVEGLTATGSQATVFDVYKSGMPLNGQITLGGNMAGGGTGSKMYAVVVGAAQEHGSVDSGVIALKYPSGTAGTEAFAGSMGFSFTVIDPIYVLDLGVFYPLGDAAMPGDLNCRLYNMLTGSKVAEIVFSPDNPGDKEGAALWKALRQPLLLPAGFKGVVAADGYGATMQNGNSESSPVWTFQTGGGKVQYGTEALKGEKGQMPDQVAGPPGNKFAAATFRFQPQ